MIVTSLFLFLNLVFVYVDSRKIKNLFSFMTFWYLVMYVDIPFTPDIRSLVNVRLFRYIYNSNYAYKCSPTF
jgi:hypothetical protein